MRFPAVLCDDRPKPWDVNRCKSIYSLFSPAHIYSGKVCMREKKRKAREWHFFLPYVNPLKTKKKILFSIATKHTQGYHLTIKCSFTTLNHFSQCPLLVSTFLKSSFCEEQTFWHTFCSTIFMDQNLPFFSRTHFHNKIWWSWSIFPCNLLLFIINTVLNNCVHDLRAFLWVFFFSLGKYFFSPSIHVCTKFD